MTLGGIGNVIAYVRGSKDIVFVGGVKRMMTESRRWGIDQAGRS
jgi:hypothetical protein